MVDTVSRPDSKGVRAQYRNGAGRRVHNGDADRSAEKDRKRAKAMGGNSSRQIADEIA